MGMLKEFQKFAMKGNVVDMAVGIVIGGAFGTIVKSLVDNILMPPIGYLTGKVDFSNLSLTLPVEGEGAEPVLIKYGLFINAVISFLIVAFALFLVIKWMNALRSRFESSEEKKAPTTKKCGECRMDIPLDAKRCGHCTSAVA